MGRETVFWLEALAIRIAPLVDDESQRQDGTGHLGGQHPGHVPTNAPNEAIPYVHRTGEEREREQGYRHAVAPLQQAFLPSE